MDATKILDWKWRRVKQIGLIATIVAIIFGVGALLLKIASTIGEAAIIASIFWFVLVMMGGDFFLAESMYKKKERKETM